MQSFKYFLISALSVVLFGATIAYAGQITVPAATGYGQVLIGQANGNYTPVATSTLNITGAASSPGGASSTVQVNQNGSFGGTTNFTFDGTTATLNALHLTNALGIAYGGTASTTLGGILAGNGTSAVKSTLIGTGLSFDGTTLSNTGITSNSGDWAGTWQTFNPSHFQVAGSYLTSAITALGPTGQTQTGATQTLASTTSTFNGLTVGLTITASGNTQTFTPSLSGTLSNSGLANSTISGVALGGTLNSHSHDGTLTGTSYNGSASVSDWGLNLGNANTWTALQQFANASSTLISAYNGAYFGATATSSFSSTGALTISTSDKNTIPNATTTNLTFSQSFGSGANKIPSSFYPSFSVATSTGWTGTTTTISLGIASVAETWDSITCKTDAGTLNLQFSNAGTLMNMVSASTTAGVQPFTSSTAFAAGAERTLTIGTPASSPTYVGCTVTKHFTF